MWLLTWYPTGCIAFLLWSFFDRNFLFNLISQKHGRVFEWALNAFGVFMWISKDALIVGVGLLCISGVKCLMSLRSRSI